MIKSAKRAAPDPVPPVVVGDVRYEVIHFGRREGLDQNGGYIVAKTDKTGEVLWTLKVYDVAYDPNGKESDSQDVFITTMRKMWFRPKLWIADELGRRFVVDLNSKTVSP